MITELLYIAGIFLLARYNADLISHDIPVRHRWNGALHLLFWVYSYLVTGDEVLLIAFPFIGVLFFDTTLNLMRGKKWDYVTHTPTSTVDQIAIKVFGYDGATPKVIYATIAVFINVLCFVIL